LISEETALLQGARGLVLTISLPFVPLQFYRQDKATEGISFCSNLCAVLICQHGQGMYLLKL